MTPLFFYGSCLDPDVLAIVLARPVPADALRPAVLRGYRCARMPDEHYPILVRAPGARVQGALFVPAGEADVARLRWFESDEYVLRPCTVQAGDGEQVQALFCAEAAVVADAVAPWSFDQWRRTEKALFLPIARRYMEFYASGDAHAADAEWERLMSGLRTTLNARRCGNG